MKKSIFLLVIILVMLTGCKDKKVTVSPAPTATATTTPTEQPTNTPTATSTPTVFVYRANGTLISKCEDCFCSSYSDIYGNIDDFYSLDGAFGRWYLYTYDENGENPVLTDDGAVAFGGEHVTWDDIP